MKIIYKPLSRTSNEETFILIQNIKSELDSIGYDIILQTENRVEFKYNNWKPGSRTAPFSHLNGGIFEIISESKTIVLFYYLSPLYEIVSCSIAALLGFIIGPGIFYFFGGFFLIIFVIRVFVLKGTAKSLLDNILKGCGK